MFTLGNTVRTQTAPWNQGILVGQKRPLKLREVWAIRIRLQLAKNLRNLALFNLALDPGEENNLAGLPDWLDLQADMQSRLEAWWSN